MPAWMAMGWSLELRKEGASGLGTQWWPWVPVGACSFLAPFSGSYRAGRPWLTEAPGPCAGSPQARAVAALSATKHQSGMPASDRTSGLKETQGRAAASGTLQPTSEHLKCKCQPPAPSLPGVEHRAANTPVSYPCPGVYFPGISGQPTGPFPGSGG